MDFKLQTSVTVVKALACLHNFLLTEEQLLDEEEKLYVPENRRRENLNDANDQARENIDEINAEIPPHALQQREMLADYFVSDEGAI